MSAMTEICYRERQALSLGATLYVPANHKDLLSITSSHRTSARSLVICTEDALAEEHLEEGLRNIKQCLPHFMSLEEQGTQVFIRPRNQAVLRRLLAMPHIERAAGFVLPKFELGNMQDWASIMTHADPRLGVMPTLESRDVFCMEHMRQMVKQLRDGALASRVIALRIGGNDLLQCLAIRRPRGLTMYDTPLGSLIAQLCGLFKPHGFFLTAPVFEHFEDVDNLRKELMLDKAHGLVGKTAIHPSQIEIIESALAPNPMEIEEAEAILADDAKAVFKLNGSMCEVATHRHWAKRVLYLAERKKICPALRSVA
jgi:citrate lyase beta subunit